MDIQTFGKVTGIEPITATDDVEPIYQVTYTLKPGQNEAVKQLQDLLYGNADCVIVTRPIR